MNKLDLVLRAAVFAAEKHRGQVRKEIAAGLLHDTIEDTPTVHDDLLEAFGERVAGLVAELTDDKRLPKAVRKERQVEHAPHLSHDAKQIKLADKLCNLRELVASPPPGWSHEHTAQTLDWSMRVVNGIRGANPALELRFDEACERGTATLLHRRNGDRPTQEKANVPC